MGWRHRRSLRQSADIASGLHAPQYHPFLSLVFQANVLTFQQLLFQGTNGHQWHQDPAYVVVDTPTFLAATWIALQDIQEGSGELADYDQSHRLPHDTFSNGARHSDGDTPNYSREMEEACQLRQLTHHRLLAKKGDVFFWAADLVHRSHPMSLPQGTPRMSCVTHYCPPLPCRTGSRSQTSAGSSRIGMSAALPALSTNRPTSAPWCGRCRAGSFITVIKA